MKSFMLFDGSMLDENVSSSSSVFGKVQAEHEDEYDDEDGFQGRH
jgi:hypothetical protein